MTKLEIKNTELIPQENEWYHVKITFNTNKILSLFVKERIEITQYDPNSKPTVTLADTSTYYPQDNY